MKAFTVHIDEAQAIIACKQTLIATAWATSHRGLLLLMGAASLRDARMEPHRATPICFVEITGCRDMQPADEAASGVDYASHRIVWELSPSIGKVSVSPAYADCRRFIYDVPDDLIGAMLAAAIRPDSHSGKCGGCGKTFDVGKLNHTEIAANMGAELRCPACMPRSMVAAAAGLFSPAAAPRRPPEGGLFG